MEKLYKSLTKLPDLEEEYIVLKADGKAVKKTRTIKDRYLLTLLDGNSVALTADKLKDFRISVADVEKKEKVDKIVEEITKTNENPNNGKDEPEK